MPYKQVPTSTHPIDDSEHQATLTGCFRGLGNVGKKITHMNVVLHFMDLIRNQ